MPSNLILFLFWFQDTFEYPELEGHEFVCNHLAPKLKGRPRGRRRRAPRPGDSPSPSPPSGEAEPDSDERSAPSVSTFLKHKQQLHQHFTKKMWVCKG